MWMTMGGLAMHVEGGIETWLLPGLKPAFSLRVQFF